jgi:hypothetical protein
MWDTAWTNGALRIHQRKVSETAAAVQRGDPDRVEIVPTLFNTPGFAPKCSAPARSVRSMP